MRCTTPSGLRPPPPHRGGGSAPPGTRALFITTTFPVQRVWGPRMTMCAAAPVTLQRLTMRQREVGRGVGGGERALFRNQPGGVRARPARVQDLPVADVLRCHLLP